MAESKQRPTQSQEEFIPMVDSKITINGQLKNRMRDILTERGITIKALAALMGYYYTPVWRFCVSDQESANLLIMAKVCEVLGIQPGDIFIYEPNQPSDFTDLKMGEFAAWLLEQAGRDDLVGNLAENLIQKLKQADPLIPLHSTVKQDWQDYPPFDDHRTAFQVTWKEWTRNKRRQTRYRNTSRKRFRSLKKTIEDTL
jgi:DNA-binding Xre family transcriptional regulator